MPLFLQSGRVLQHGAADVVADVRELARLFDLHVFQRLTTAHFGTEPVHGVKRVAYHPITTAAIAGE